MRTDAMESFFSGNGAVAKRMDCTGYMRKSSAGMESAARENVTDSKKPFQKALAEVTAGNIAAHRATKTALGRIKKKCLIDTENNRIYAAFRSNSLKLKTIGM